MDSSRRVFLKNTSDLGLSAKTTTSPSPSMKLTSKIRKKTESSIPTDLIHNENSLTHLGLPPSDLIRVESFNHETSPLPIDGSSFSFSANSPFEDKERPDPSASIRRNLHGSNLNEKDSLRGARSFSDVYTRFASSALAFPHVKSNVSVSTSVTDNNNQQPPSSSSMANGLDEFSNADNADDIKLVSVEFRAGEKQLPPSSNRVGSFRMSSRKSSFTKFHRNERDRDVSHRADAPTRRDRDNKVCDLRASDLRSYTLAKIDHDVQKRKKELTRPRTESDVTSHFKNINSNSSTNELFQTATAGDPILNLPNSKKLSPQLSRRIAKSNYVKSSEAHSEIKKMPSSSFAGMTGFSEEDEHRKTNLLDAFIGKTHAMFRFKAKSHQEFGPKSPSRK